MGNQWVTRFTAEMVAEWWSECTKSEVLVVVGYIVKIERSRVDGDDGKVVSIS